MNVKPARDSVPGDIGGVPSLIALFILPLAFFAPNIWTGGVMLPLDILGHLAPFSGSIPGSLAQVRNPHISDLVSIYYPWTELFRTANGVVPLWNPYSFCGSPLLANAQNGVLFPLSWLWRFLPPAAASVMLAVAKMWFCGVFAFLFYRRVGFRALSSLSGATVFMFSGHVIVWLGYPTSFPLISMPFLFWSLERFLNGVAWRNVAWIAVGFGLVFIGGQPQTGLLIGISAALYFGIRSWSQCGRRTRLWAGFSTAAVLGLCLSAPQVLPFAEYLQQSAAGRLRGAFGWKHYPWYTLLSWVVPRFFGDVRLGNFWGFSSQLGEAVYIGAIPLVFATVGFIRSRKRSYFGAITAVFLFGCLGLFVSLLARLYLEIPLLSNIDNNKLMALVTFGLVSFSVAGVELLLDHSIPAARLLSDWCIAALAWIVFLAFGLLYFREAIRAMGLTSFELREICWLFAVLLCATVILWLASRRRIAVVAACSLVMVVTVVDIFRIWVGYYPSFPAEYLRPHSESVSYLEKNAGTDRIIGIGGLLPPETSALFRIQDARGYDGMTPYAYYRVLGVIEPGIHDFWQKLHTGLPWAGRPESNAWTSSTLFYRSLQTTLDTRDVDRIAALRQLDYWSSDISGVSRASLFSLLGVRFVLTPRGSPAPGHGLRLVHASDAEVWEDPDALPRAFVVSSPFIAANGENAFEIVSAGNFDPKTKVVITGGTRTAAEPQARFVPAHISDYQAERVEVSVDSPFEGWLVLTDLYYPGWEATVDGSREDIYPANYLFRAVKIPPGSHHVKFSYRPRSYHLGIWLSSLAAFAALVLAIMIPRAIKPASREHSESMQGDR